MNWTTLETDRGTVLVSERGGISFKIVDPNGRCPIAFVDGTKYGHASVGIESVKQWCEDFEYCYECHEKMVHADKLCFDCYFQ